MSKFHRPRFIRNLFSYCVLVFCITFLTLSARADPNIMFIVDASGSMKEKIGDETRIDAAKSVMARTLSELPQTANLGLLVYGHRRAKDCTDIELVAPLGSEDSPAIAKIIDNLDAKGETPIAEAMTKAAKSFKAFKGQRNSIILVTDGLEECRGDPCAAAEKLKDAGLDISVNIVGFTLEADKAAALQCVTETTGGQYYAAADASALTQALKDVQGQVQETTVVAEAKPAPARRDILAEKNGGTLLIAPNKRWADLNRNHDSFSKVINKGATYFGQGIWSFRDNKSATFDQVEVLIPKANNYNLKGFEILAADDRDGPYRSLGEFEALNSKVLPQGWQGFKFPQTSAYFVKIVFKSAQNERYTNGNALRLIGTIDEASEPYEVPPEAEGEDVLSAKLGGKLLIAPNKRWADLNRNHDSFSKVTNKGATYLGRGIWSFKDNKSATFDQVEVLIPAANRYNLKGFEILAADQKSGPYRSLGEFEAINARVFPQGWQAFKFSETSAYFVKVVFKSAQSERYTNGHALRLIGSIDEASEPYEVPPEAEGEDVLSAKLGGKLLIAPNNRWADLNRNHDSFSKVLNKGATYLGRGIWSFRDNKSATFDQVEVLIPAANRYNLKGFEILAADQKDGPYRSLGEFEAINARVFPQGWQAFKFSETSAYFVKVVFKSAQSERYTNGHALRLIGSIDEASEPYQALPDPQGDDILSPAFGGKLEYAPNSTWAYTTQQRSKLKKATYAGEAVWSFKDGKAARFDNIQVQVAKREGYTLKNFEVFTSDSRSGPYRSVGQFTVKNHKVMPDGWQTFRFAETAGHFVKVKFQTSYGSYVGGNPIRILGKIDESSDSVQPLSAPEGSDLIAQSQGGSLLMSPNDDWQKLSKNLTGNAARAVVRQGEGVWAFDEEKPAIVNAVQVYIPKGPNYNLKDFEILIGNDGPTADFRSLGVFTAQDHRVMPDGWQTFTFPKTEGRYIKLKTMSGYSSYITMYGFRVFGDLQEQ